MLRIADSRLMACLMCAVWYFYLPKSENGYEITNVILAILAFFILLKNRGDDAMPKNCCLYYLVIPFITISASGSAMNAIWNNGKIFRSC